ncbi:MAG: FHA domain-containing protein [Clostridiales bacterium]|nr:FHA domain-containing protein [Clostridiales bacterium]
MDYWYSKTIYRKIILILSAIQFLGFFLFPYAYASSKSLNSLANMFRKYSGVTFPEKLTGFNYLKLYLDINGDDAIFLIGLLVLIIIVVVIHALGKKRKSYSASLGVELIILMFNYIFIDAADSMTGYRFSKGAVMIILVDLLILAASVLGMLFEMKAQAALSVNGGSAGSFDSEKFAQNMGTAGNVIVNLAKQAGAQLAKIPGAVRNTVDSAKDSSGSSSASSSRNANQARPVSRPASARPGTASSAPVQSSIPQTGVMTGVRGAFAGAQIPLNSGEEMVVGRSADICNIILEGDLISRKHCTICYDGRTGYYVVTDFSGNGTFIGSGARLPEGKRTSLAPGTVIWIGSKDVSFQLG